MYKLCESTFQSALWSLLLGGLFVCRVLQANAQAPGLPKPADDRDQPNSTPVRILIGKVVVEGGSDVVRDTSVVLECGGSVRARADVSSDGGFSLNPNARQADDVLTSRQDVAWQSADKDNCELYGDAPGYTSDRLYVANEGPTSGMVHVGNVTLHPLSSPRSNENSTVSVGSLAAPAKAKKAFEKGQKHLKTKDWPSASKEFEEAVRFYPHYAIAWLELGRVQFGEGQFSQALKSFQQASAEDTHLAGAYAGIVSVAVKQNNWGLLGDATDHLTQLSADSPAIIWFLNSLGKFNSGRIQEAELSAEKGLRLDTRHTVPQLEYLYGMILAKEQNYAQAVEHVKAYLQLAPHAEDAGNAQSNLSQLEQLASDKRSNP
jgi:tetratricopeptide (TPR) repeat protein